MKCSRYSAAPTELLIFVSSVYPGFHFGLCPHSTLGFAGVSPLQGSLSYWTFAELCRGIVFVVFIPLGHLLAWVSVALAGLIVVLGVCGVVSWYCVR